MALVSSVHKGGGWHQARQALDLFELAFERVPVVRILWAAHGAHDKAFLVRYLGDVKHALTPNS